MGIAPVCVACEHGDVASINPSLEDCRMLMRILADKHWESAKLMKMGFEI